MCGEIGDQTLQLSRFLPSPLIPRVLAHDFCPSAQQSPALASRQPPSTCRGRRQDTSLSLIFLLSSLAPNQVTRKIQYGPPRTLQSPLWSSRSERFLGQSQPDKTLISFCPSQPPTEFFLRTQPPGMGQKQQQQKDNLGDRVMGEGGLRSQGPIPSLANCPGGSQEGGLGSQTTGG